MHRFAQKLYTALQYLKIESDSRALFRVKRGEKRRLGFIPCEVLPFSFSNEKPDQTFDAIIGLFWFLFF